MDGEKHEEIQDPSETEQDLENVGRDLAVAACAAHNATEGSRLKVEYWKATAKAGEESASQDAK